MTDENKSETKPETKPDDKTIEKRISWLRNPRNRGIINGVAVFGIMCISQVDGLFADPRPLNARDIAAYAVTGLVVGVLLYSYYNWRERRAKRKESEKDT